MQHNFEINPWPQDFSTGWFFQSITIKTLSDTTTLFYNHRMQQQCFKVIRYSCNILQLFDISTIIYNDQIQLQYLISYNATTMFYYYQIKLQYCTITRCNYKISTIIRYNSMFFKIIKYKYNILQLSDTTPIFHDA